MQLSFFPPKWGNMSWNGSPDIPESKQMASMSFWCRNCHVCCQHKHRDRPYQCQFIGPVGKCGDKCVKTEESKHWCAFTVQSWNMCMLNTVPMVTELGKHSTAKVSEFAQMQGRLYIYIKTKNIDIVNPDKFVFIQKLQAGVSRCCHSLLKEVAQETLADVWHEE